MSTSHFYLQEIWEGRMGSLDEDGIREYSRTFLAGMSNLAADALEVTAGVGIYSVPQRLSPYVSQNADGSIRATDLGARLVKYECRQQDDPQMWKIYCRYSSDWRKWRRSSYQPKEGGGGTNKGDSSEINPLLQPADISWETVKFQKPILYDLDGDAICSSANEDFSPPVMRDETRMVLTIEKNMPSYNPATYLKYFDRVNSTDWILGIRANTAKCDGISGRSVLDRGQFFYKVRATFHIIDYPDNPVVTNQYPWELVVIDQGSWVLDANGNPEHVKDPKTGQGVNGIFRLNGLGGLNPPNAPIHWRRFDIYETIDFNQLQGLYP